MPPSDSPLAGHGQSGGDPQLLKDLRGEGPLAPRRLADALREAIIFGELAPQSRLVEEEVAERYGVSRSPVREVLRILEADGLLVREERRGGRVSAMSRRDLDEVYACRIPLEGLAAAEAARNWTPGSLVTVMDALRDLEKTSTQSDIRRYFRANVRFTDAIYVAGANLTLKRLLVGISMQAQRYRYLAYSRFPSLIDASVDGSRKVVSRIRERDAAGAARTNEMLVENSWLTIRESFD